MSDRKPEPTLAGSTDVLVHERASAMRPPRHAHAARAVATSRASADAGPAIAPPLRALQEWFAAVTTHPESVDAGVEAAARAGHESLAAVTAEEAGRVVKGDARLDALSRLGVYHDAYRARLVECLADDYPAVQHALGEDAFTGLCHAYIAAHPSRGPSLNPYGKSMGAFLRDRERPASSHALRFAADLAALEWALVEVIHAAKAPVLDLEKLRAIAPDAWGQARLPAAETLRLVRTAYPVNHYFQRFKEDEAQAELPGAEPSAVAVYRVGFVLWRMDLTPAMADLLAGLMAGKTLGAALESLDDSVTDAEELAEAERQVMAWFQSWVASGFFARVDLA